MKHDQKFIRDLAYRLWEARGRPAGSAHDDWLEAERQVAERQIADSSKSSPVKPSPATASAPGASPSGAASPSGSELDEALKDTFPASDPPAGGLPDNPPSNAEEKWQAAATSKTANRRAKDSGGAKVGSPGTELEFAL